MLVRGDIAELFALADERYAVMVCQHDYTPRDEIKFLERTQSRYAKKNWSSVMLLNNARCRALTPDYVQAATGLDLHQFKWLPARTRWRPAARVELAGRRIRLQSTSPRRPFHARRTVPAGLWRLRLRR